MTLISTSVPQRDGMIQSEPERSNNIKKLKPANSEDVIENLNY